MNRSLLAVTAAGVVACHDGGDAGPPAYRTLAAARVMDGEADFSTRVKFGLGQFRMLPGAESELYRYTLVFDEVRFRPSASYSAESRRLVIGLEPADVRGNWSLDQQRLELALNPVVPTRLALELGAVQNELDLGGLSLSRIDIATGASETRLHFDRPNRIQCTQFELKVGAADLRAEGLGNARCARYAVVGGVGDLTIGMGGQWADSATARLDVKVGVGAVRIRLPPTIGATVRMSKFLVDFTASRFTKLGDVYVSDNFDSVTAKLDIRVEAAFGEVRVEWIEEA